MKKIFIILACFTALQSMGQQLVNPFPKTITVNGSAEMEVVPDEIYVQVDLKEYQKKGDKISIDQIKNSFLDNVKKLGIPDSVISIASYEGSNGQPWWKKKKKDKDPDLLASIAYQVKLNSAQQVDQLVNVLDDEATFNFQVIRTSHSRLNEWRKQLKLQAVKAAREKADYLASAINEKAGEAITINEPGDVSGYYNPGRMYSLMDEKQMSNTIVEQSDLPQNSTIVDFRKIKLKFEVNVVFALR